ncbi:MAG TPA: thiamine phosphate synthase [Verrucomicrobiae bacterium]|nr:thiamine phosphate synthase [Verrucomicrobiae bacterium]
MATHETARLTRAQRAARLHGIYAIVNGDARDPLACALAALGAGIRIVQYRAKSGIVPDTARALRALTAERGALLIFNDDWQAALAFDGDGVHLGPGDDGFAHVATVRARIGERLIGLSCGTPEEARAAGDADYLGVGSLYATRSKSDAGAPIGIAGLLAVAAATALPVAAIGGIDASNLPAVARSGVAMAAVISAIADAADPSRAASELVAIWNAR